MSKIQYLREHDEEVLNALTHAIAFGMFLTGTIAIYVKGAQINSMLGAAALIYGLSQTLTYFSSCMYHIVSEPVLKKKLRLVDHLTIYLAIAGTYTPFFIAGVPEPYNFILVCLIWILCGWGIYYKSRNIGKDEVFSIILYLVLGWCGILVFGICDTAALNNSFSYILAGGAFYTAGTYFYWRDFTKYNHTIWHLMVMIASAIHYYAVWNYIIVVQ